ncbi:MAG: hypothetical protein FJZ58_02115, partial [Chlamydiae bacterium]|nr:hypothetical protein [Chlamydiota bacterium]
MQTSPIFSSQSFLEGEHSLFKQGRPALAIPFKIEPIIPYAMHSPEIVLHVQEIEKLLRKSLPVHLLQLPTTLFQEQLLKEIPLLLWKKPESSPGCLDLFLLCLASKEEKVDVQIETILRDCLVQDRPTTLVSTQSLFFLWDLFPGKSFLILKT